MKQTQLLKLFGVLLVAASMVLSSCSRDNDDDDNKGGNGDNRPVSEKTGANSDGECTEATIADINAKQEPCRRLGETPDRAKILACRSSLVELTEKYPSLNCRASSGGKNVQITVKQFKDIIQQIDDLLAGNGANLQSYDQYDQEGFNTDQLDFHNN